MCGINIYARHIHSIFEADAPRYRRNSLKIPVSFIHRQRPVRWHFTHQGYSTFVVIIITLSNKNIKRLDVPYSKKFLYINGSKFIHCRLCLNFLY